MKTKLTVGIIMILVSIMCVSMIAYAEGTPEERKVDKPNFCAEDSGPYPLKEDELIASQFSISADAKFVGVGCPSWSDNIGEMTFNLYKFDKDYATTVKSTPIATNKFENYTDNYYLGFAFTSDKPLKAGEYLIEISEAYDDSGTGVGVWAQKKYAGQNLYEDGIYNADLSLRMHIEFINAPETPYGQLTPVSVSTEDVNKDPNPFMDAVMRFSDPDAESYYNMTNAVSIGDAAIEDGKLSVPVLAGNDPQFYIDIASSLSAVPCDQYPVALIRMKRVEGSPLNGEIFFCTTEFTVPAAGGSVTFSYQDTTEWQDVIVDFGSNKNFKGDLMSFRFDIVQASEGDFTYLIDYILFFGTVEAAEAFDDISTLPTPSPTPEPTPTPEKTATPVPTSTVAPKSTDSTDVEKEKSNAGTIIIAVVVVAVLAIAAAAFIIIKKKAKQ